MQAQVQTQYRDPKDVAKYVDSFARKCLSRIHRLGAKSQTLDDVKQELWYAWCKACETYREECGASFLTYFRRGMQVYINRYIETNFERFHDQTIALSLDYAAPGQNDATIAEVIPDNKENGFTAFEHETSFEYALTRLSPRARQFITILKDQPQAVMAEVRKFEDKSSFAKSRGISSPAHHRLTTFMIFDLMGASRNERAKISTELEQLSRVLSN